MIILIYIGILLLCYGIYHMLCYLSMLPTLASVRNMTSYGQKKTDRYSNALFVILAEKIAKKWELEWNGSERMVEVLHYNRIYYPVAVYCISRIMTAICGLFLCLPLLFWNKGWFTVLTLGAFIVVLTDPVILLHRYKKHMLVERPAAVPFPRKYCGRKCIRLLPGVFFICQIILLMAMLT